MQSEVEREKEESVSILLYVVIFTRYLCGGQHCVFIQAEDSIGHYGLVRQKTTAHHLQRESQSTKG